MPLITLWLDQNKKLEGKTETDIKTKPASYHEACIKRVEGVIHQPLVKRSRITYSTADDSVRIVCAVSKPYEKSDHTLFWFAFHPHQKDYLEGVQAGYLAFGCGTDKTLLVIPFQEYAAWLEGMNITEDGERFFWHVNIIKDDRGLSLYRKKGFTGIDLNKFLVVNKGN